MSKFKKLNRFSSISVGDGNEIGFFYSEFEMIYYSDKYLEYFKGSGYFRCIIYSRCRLLNPSKIIIKYGIQILKR